MTDILLLLALNLALIVVVMLALWALALRLKDVSFIDGVWGLGMVLLAGATFVQTDGDPLRKGLLTGLCAVWGIRLGVHLLKRWRAHGPDRRYQALLKSRANKGQGFAPASLMFVFLPQAVLLWLTCLPVQLGQVAATPAVGWIGWTGAALALLGIVFETVGDAQLSAFKRDPDSKGKVLDTGLWRYTRHPNYFGDACVWWGLWLVAAETTPGLFAILGPIFLTFTLTKWSGAPTTEGGMHKSRPGYADYVARTSGFFPLPPKKTAG
jgi:steroid 5-alpha reductase family enzyme